jgi:hypothetical protein
MSHNAYQLPVGRPKPGEPAALVVPKDLTFKNYIDAGSAIVAYAYAEHGSEETRLIAYYESNRFGAENMQTFEDMAYHAYSRMSTKYPTVAQTMADISDFVVVGAVTQDGIMFEDCPELQAWLNLRPGMPVRSEILSQKRKLAQLCQYGHNEP